VKRFSTLRVLIAATQVAAADLPFDATPVATFNEPWAMAFLPDGRRVLKLTPR